MDQIFPHERREIEHFFNIYKELEGRATSTLGWEDRGAARRMILDYRGSYLRRNSSD